MKRFLFITLMLTLTSAVNAGTGSNYTIFGVGDLRLAGSVRNTGLGYAGLALADGRSINVTSPAAWSKIADTRIEAGLLHESFDATDGTKSLTVSQTNFNGASMAVPISTLRGIVIVASMTPYSNKDYNVFTTGSQLGMDYVLNHEGSGGLGRAQIGASFAPFPFLSLGASFNYLFGSLENSRTLLPTSLDFAGGVTTGRTITNGITGTYGLLLNGTGGLIPFLDPLSIGAVLTNRSYLNTEADLKLEFLTEADTVQLQSTEITIPLSYGVGAAYEVTPRWVFAADYLTQAWSEAGFRSPARDMELYALGIERKSARQPTAGFFDRIAVRLGYYNLRTYYVVNGEPITEWGVTGGLGVPFSGESRVNLAVEFGGRGSTGNNLIQESIFRFSLGITISEIWFLTFEEE